MSLLIKALDKAQAEKAQSQHADEKPKKAAEKPNKSKKPRVSKANKETLETPESLSLSPKEETLAETTDDITEQAVDALDVADASKDDLPVALQDSPAASVKPKQAQASPELTVAPLASIESSAQAQAANVFSSKRIEPSHQTAKIAMIVGLLALALLAIFAYWYQFVFNQPEIVIPPRPPALDQQAANSAPIALEPTVSEAPVIVAEDTPTQEAVAEPESASEDDAVMAKPAAKKAQSQSAEQVDQISQPETATVAGSPRERTSVFAENQVAATVEDTLTENEKVVAVEADALPELVEPDVSISTSQHDIQVTQKKTDTGVNAVLMRAYEAYNAGNDAQAQTDYKVVLQRYGLNVDAMLGLGAIAARQGRQADAQGWYQKVLQVEPRNEVANAGLLSLQGTQQQVLNQSQIKSMLQASPDDANLQATLGDTYALQGNWPDAQQAYFEAYRLKQSAENAFNLAVSLDQMGKADIALPYYQEALSKIDQSSAIDKTALEARISSIQ